MIQVTDYRAMLRHGDMKKICAITGLSPYLLKTRLEKHDAPDVSDTIQTDEITVKLNNSLKILHWYELEILRLYSENGQNIMSLSRDTGIPYRSLMKTIKKTKTLLKYKIKNHVTP